MEFTSKAKRDATNKEALSLRVAFSLPMAGETDNSTRDNRASESPLRAYSPASPQPTESSSESPLQWESHSIVESLRSLRHPCTLSLTEARAAMPYGISEPEEWRSSDFATDLRRICNDLAEGSLVICRDCFKVADTWEFVKCYHCEKYTCHEHSYSRQQENPALRAYSVQGYHCLSCCNAWREQGTSAG